MEKERQKIIVNPKATRVVSVHVVVSGGPMEVVPSNTLWMNHYRTKSAVLWTKRFLRLNSHGIPLVKASDAMRTPPMPISQYRVLDTSMAKHLLLVKKRLILTGNYNITQ